MGGTDGFTNPFFQLAGVCIYLVKQAIYSKRCRLLTGLYMIQSMQHIQQCLWYVSATDKRYSLRCSTSRPPGRGAVARADFFAVGSHSRTPQTRLLLLSQVLQ